jgi:Leishmanolysin
MARPAQPFRPNGSQQNATVVFEWSDLLAKPEILPTTVLPVAGRAPVQAGEQASTQGIPGTINSAVPSSLRSAMSGDAVPLPTGRLMTTYTSGAVGKYNVTVNFQGVSGHITGGWTPAMQGTIVAAAERISKLIVGDLPPVVANGKKIDDIQITATMTEMDGTGGVLAQAGMTAVRDISKLPYTSLMRFDTADAQRYLNMGLFDEIVTHEMLTCLGVGTLWKAKNLVAGANFIGPHTIAAYNDLVDEYAATHGGSLTLGNGTVLFKDLVPLETSGGAGTAGSHWSENIFNSELMTGYLDTVPSNGTVPAPLSAMTLASLKDLGYVTGEVGATDAFRLI